MSILSKLKSFFNPTITEQVRINGGTLEVYINEALDFCHEIKDSKEIFAFKRDLGGTDVVCIGFRLDEEGAFYDVTEEIEGFQDVVTYVENNFMLVNQDWFKQVMDPPFETSYTLIWGESKMCDIWRND